MSMCLASDLKQLLYSGRNFIGLSYRRLNNFFYSKKRDVFTGPEQMEI